MNEHMLTIMAAIAIYASRAKSDDLPDQRARVLAESFEEAQLFIAEAALKVHG